MLDSKEIARRLREAMDKAEPRVTSVALAEACGVTPQAVSGWRKTGRVAKRHLQTVGKLTGRPLEYFLGSGAVKFSMAEPQAAYGQQLEAKEEILLRLFAGLFSAQQREIISEVRALFDANQVTRKELGQKALRGVSDAQIVTAFGQAPAPTKPEPKKRPRSPGREPGTAMDDFLE